MKSLTDQLELVHAVYNDACAKCVADVSDVRDLLTIDSRVVSEGLSFLTITLPDFCKDFERSLAEGRIVPSAFRSFRKTGAIPSFLKGMLGRLFDQETGRMLDLDADSPTYVEAIRQLCLLFKKAAMPCTPERNARALDNFVSVERLNSDFAAPADVGEFLTLSDMLWYNMLAGFDPQHLVPQHGPGATAEGISGNQKYLWRRWHERLEEFLPFWGSGYQISAYGEGIEDVTFVSPEQEDPVRVVLVPKTLKSPRVIAIEPVCMQYAQQALRDFLYASIESYWLTRGQINFSDQTVNKKLALTSSSDGRFATIDLSDASDRVPRSLALEMLRSVPLLRDAVDACRSKSANLPDGRHVADLQKFASMGSALCFPIEAMYFYTLCVMALLREADLPVTPSNIYKVSRRIWVYGDDIIVPSEKATIVVDCLQRYNCKVNSSKSFWTGKFRESCGTDAFDGRDVTPVYLRELRPHGKQQSSKIISWIATANAFYKKGFWRSASLMYCTIEKYVGPLPYVSEDDGAIGRVSFRGYRGGEVFRESWRYNQDLQTLEIRVLRPKSVNRSDSVDGYPALQKCLLKLEARDRTSNTDASERGDHVETHDQHHLERSALRGAVTLKLRWVRATLGTGVRL